MVGIILVDVLVLMVVLPILIWQLQEYNAKPHVQLWFIAGLFMLLTFPVFLFGLVQHLTHYSRPDLQRHIIRILWLVPIYSVDSFIALRFPKAAIYVDTLRECYEAYTLYNFLRYLQNYLESEYNLIEEFEKRGSVRCSPPLCCVPPLKLNIHFIRRCKFGVLQYAVLKLIVTTAAFITHLAGVYKEGEFHPDNAWLYLAIVNALSQAVALQTLFFFYKCVRHLLKPIKPLGKFMSIKAIVFFAFWQGVILALIDKIGLFQSTVWEDYGIDHVATGLQDFIICIEMFLAAIVHYFVFSHKPFVDGRAKIPCLESIVRMLDIRDVGEDVKEQALHFQHRAKDAAVSAKNVAAKVLRVPGKGDKTNDVEMQPLLKGDHNSSGDPHQSLFSHTQRGAVQYSVATTEVELPPSTLPPATPLLHGSEIQRTQRRTTDDSSSSSSSLSTDDSMPSSGADTRGNAD
jgi:uncharacterized protein Usg